MWVGRAWLGDSSVPGGKVRDPSDVFSMGQSGGPKVASFPSLVMEVDILRCPRMSLAPPSVGPAGLSGQPRIKEMETGSHCPTEGVPKNIQLCLITPKAYGFILMVTFHSYPNIIPVVSSFILPLVSWFPLRAMLKSAVNLFILLPYLFRMLCFEVTAGKLILRPSNPPFVTAVLYLVIRA